MASQDCKSISIEIINKHQFEVDAKGVQFKQYTYGKKFFSIILKKIINFITFYDFYAVNYRGKYLIDLREYELFKRAAEKKIPNVVFEIPPKILKVIRASKKKEDFQLRNAMQRKLQSAELSAFMFGMARGGNFIASGSVEIRQVLLQMSCRLSRF
jgi:hypothetical protein